MQQHPRMILGQQCHIKRIATRGDMQILQDLLDRHRVA
jgi:hypothetical protein